MADLPDGYDPAGSASPVPWLSAVRRADRRPVWIRWLPAREDTLETALYSMELERNAELVQAGALRMMGIHGAGRRAAMVCAPADGPSWQSLVRPGEIDAALTRIMELARQLEVGHNAGRVHGDLEPRTVFEGPEGLQLSPWSLARRLRDPDARATPEDLAWSQAFSAPEISPLLEGHPDPRADLYALGALLFWMLTGRPPYERPDALSLLHAHLAAPLPALEGASLKGVEVPEGLEAIIQRLMAKDPRDRYQSIAGLVVDLETIQSGEVLDAHTLGRADRVERLTPHPPLVAREPQLALLDQAVARMASCGRPALTVIHGAAGVGKTALVGGMRPRAMAHRALAVSGKFDQQAQQVPAGALCVALRALIRRVLSAPEATVAEASARLSRTLGVSAAALAESVPELAHLIEMPSVEAVGGPVEARKRFVRAMVGALTALARPEAPIILLVDDLHWSGPIGLEVVEALLDPEVEGHLLVVATSRPEGMAERHPLRRCLDRLADTDRAAEIIQLEPLDEPGTIALTQTWLGQTEFEVQALGVEVYDRTHGNPFSVRVLLEDLVKREELTPGVGGWRQGGSLQGLPVPGVVLKTRLGEIGADVCGLIADAALLGDAATYERLALGIQVSRKAVIQTLSSPDIVGLLDPDPWRVRFAHDLVQASALEIDDEASRVARRLRLGRALRAEPALAAECLNPVLDQLDGAERAALAQWNLEAGHTAMRITAWNRAQGHFKAGLLAAVPDSEVALSLAVEQVAACYAASEPEVGDTCYEAIETERLTPEQMLRLAHVRLYELTRRAQFQAAIDSALVAMEQIGRAPAQPAGLEEAKAQLARINRRILGMSTDDFLNLPRASQWVNDLARLLAELSSAASVVNIPLLVSLQATMLEWTLEDGLLGVTPFALAQASVFQSQLYQDEVTARLQAQQALDLLDAGVGAVQAGRVLVTVGNGVLAFTSSVARGRATTVRGIQHYLESGDTLWAGYACIIDGYNAVAEGRSVTEVARVNAHALAFAERYGNVYVGYAELAHGWAEALLARPEIGVRASLMPTEEADEAILATYTGFNGPAALVYPHVLKAHLLLVNGDDDAARACLAQGHGSLDAWHGHRITLEHRALWLALHEPLDQPDEEARGTLERVQAAGEGQLTHLLRWIEAEKALAHGSLKALVYFDEAIDEALALNAVIWAATFATRAAIGLERAGIQAQAEVYQTRAHALWSRAGARVFGEAPSTSERTTLGALGALKAARSLLEASTAEARIQRLLTVVMEMAGAERAALITWSKEGWQAQATWPSGWSAEHASVETLRLAARTGQSVVGGEAEAELLPEGVRSLLCLPVIERGSDTVLLYAEHRRRADAFAHAPAAQIRQLAALAEAAVAQARAQAALEISEARFRALFNDAGDAVLLVQPGTMKVLEANAAWGVLTGQAESDFQGRSLLEAVEWDPHLSAWLSDGEEGDLLGALRGAGGWRQVEIRRRTLTWAQTPIVVIGARDLTRQHELESMVEQAGRMETLGHLTSGAVHDLNNLLTVVMGNVALIQEDIAPPEEALEEIQHACERAATLTRRLLAFGRKQGRAYDVCMVDEVMPGLERLLARLTAQRWAVRFDLQAPDARVPLAPTRLEQIVMNLVINARDALPDGGTIDVVTRADADQALIQVRDSGVGMTPELIERIFDPFFTTKPEERGSGLGLAIVRDLVRAASGDIEVESAPGAGTTFFITLPRVATEEARVEAPASSERLTGTESILFVEGAEAIRSVVRRGLESRGYEVITAESLSGAEALLAERAFDVVVVASELPDGPGRRLLEALRHSGVGLLSCGWPEEASEEADIPLLLKPYTVEALIKATRQALEERGSLDNPSADA